MPRFSAIQTHLSRRFYLAVEFPGLRIRALGRHLCRVIFKMLSQERPYWIDP